MFKPNLKQFKISENTALFENGCFRFFENNSKTNQKFNIFKTVLDCLLNSLKLLREARSLYRESNLGHTVLHILGKFSLSLLAMAFMDRFGKSCWMDANLRVDFGSVLRL